MPRALSTALPALLLLTLAACGDARTDDENRAGIVEDNQAANAATDEALNTAALEQTSPEPTPPAAKSPAAVARPPADPRPTADPQGETRSDPVPPPQPAPRQGLDPHADHPPGNHM